MKKNMDCDNSATISSRRQKKNDHDDKPDQNTEEPDLLLEDFFHDIEKLAIHDDDDECSKTNIVQDGDVKNSMVEDTHDIPKSSVNTNHQDEDVTATTTHLPFTTNADHVMPSSYLNPHQQQYSNKNIQRTNTKNMLLNHVEKNQQSWQEFQIESSSSVVTSATSSTASATVTSSTTTTPKISFSLTTKKKKKKKSKKQTKRDLESSSSSSTTTTTTTASTPNPFPSSSASTTEAISTTNLEESLPSGPIGFQQQQQQHQRPRWIVVLDTCAVIESFDTTCDIIDTAIAAASKKELRGRIGRGSSFMDTPNNHHEVQTNSWVEPITVVIPYKLWTELDYRTKETSMTEEQQYKARRALRMLNKELDQQHHTQQQQQQQQQRSQLEFDSLSKSNQKSCLDDAVSIRSQSRRDMDHAAREFLQQSSNTNTNNDKNGIPINNDDHILSCALAEQRRFLYMTTLDGTTTTTSSGLPPPPNPTTIVGGVVLLTLDKVLSGKARADEIQVCTPEAFIDYYKKRSTSLAQRATRTRRMQYN